MLAAASGKLNRLRAEHASAAAIEDASTTVKALQIELGLARSGQLPSVLDALRGLAP
jgi:hypothetical protein